MEPVDKWKLKIKMLTEMKAAMFHLYSMHRPHMNVERAIKNEPAIKIVRRPKLMITNIASSDDTALFNPMT